LTALASGFQGKCESTTAWCVRDEKRLVYFGCCSVLGLAASSARFAIHASYSGVPGRGGASAGRPPIACGIKSPTCTLLQDGSDRTARQRNADWIAFATWLISDFMPSDCGARRTSRCCAAVSSPAASAHSDRSDDISLRSFLSPARANAR